VTFNFTKLPKKNKIIIIYLIVFVIGLVFIVGIFSKVIPRRILDYNLKKEHSLVPVTGATGDLAYLNSLIGNNNLEPGIRVAAIIAIFAHHVEPRMNSLKIHKIIRYKSWIDNSDFVNNYFMSGSGVPLFPPESEYGTLCTLALLKKEGFSRRAEISLWFSTPNLSHDEIVNYFSGSLNNGTRLLGFALHFQSPFDDSNFRTEIYTMSGLQIREHWFSFGRN